MTIETGMTVRNIMVSLGAGLLLLLAACQGGMVKPAVDPATLLRQRVAAYVEARKTHNLDAEYGFFQPSYRDQVPREQFAARRNLQTSNLRLESIDFKAGEREAKVVLRADMRVMAFAMKDAPIRQRWVLEGGQWYLAARPAGESMKELFKPAAGTKVEHEKK